MVDGIASAEFSDPAIGVVAVIAAVAALIAIILRASAQRHDAADPLAGLFERETFEAEVKATECRITRIHPRGSILRGQIDHLTQVDTLWGPQTRREAVSQVAQVMRAGVRKGDVVLEADGLDSDGSFVIHAQGASERDAAAIAKRLLKTIGRTQIDGMGDAMRLTASFGVAARRVGESDHHWRRRADAALKTARQSGEDQVISASEWEEVKLLPAPTPASDEMDAVQNQASAA